MILKWPFWSNGAERSYAALVKVEFCNLKCVLKSFIVQNGLLAVRIGYDRRPTMWKKKSKNSKLINWPLADVFLQLSRDLTSDFVTLLWEWVTSIISIQISINSSLCRIIRANAISFCAVRFQHIIATSVSFLYIAEICWFKITHWLTSRTSTTEHI